MGEGNAYISIFKAPNQLKIFLPIYTSYLCLLFFNMFKASDSRKSRVPLS